jgi:hypothetical protein
MAGSAFRGLAPDATQLISSLVNRLVLPNPLGDGGKFKVGHGTSKGSATEQEL